MGHHSPHAQNLLDHWFSTRSDFSHPGNNRGYLETFLIVAVVQEGYLMNKCPTTEELHEQGLAEPYGRSGLAWPETVYGL